MVNEIVPHSCHILIQSESMFHKDAHQATKKGVFEIGTCSPLFTKMSFLESVLNPWAILSRHFEPLFWSCKGREAADPFILGAGEPAPLPQLLGWPHISFSSLIGCWLWKFCTSHQGCHMESFRKQYYGPVSFSISIIQKFGLFE